MSEPISQPTQQDASRFLYSVEIFDNKRVKKLFSDSGNCSKIEHVKKALSEAIEELERVESVEDGTCPDCGDKMIDHGDAQECSGCGTTAA